MPLYGTTAGNGITAFQPWNVPAPPSLDVPLQRVGIFYVNPQSGDMSLAPIEGALAGMSDAYLGHQEGTGELKRQLNFVTQDGDFLSDEQINHQLYKPHSDESDGFLNQWAMSTNLNPVVRKALAYTNQLAMSTIGKNQQFWGNRITGLGASWGDLTENLNPVVRKALAYTNPITGLAEASNEWFEKGWGLSAKEIQESVQQEAQQNIYKERSIKEILDDKSSASKAAAIGKKLLFDGTAMGVDLALTAGLARSVALGADLGAAGLTAAAGAKKIASSLTASLFASDAFNSVYASNRAGGASRLSSVGLAGAAALAMGKAESYSLNKWWEGSGLAKEALKGSGGEVFRAKLAQDLLTSTAAGLSIGTSQKVLGDLGRKDVNMANSEYLRDVALDAFDSAGVMILAGLPQHTLMAKTFSENRHRINNVIRFTDLDIADRRKLVSDVASLRTALWAAGTESGELTDPQKVLLDNFSRKWGRIENLKEVLSKGVQEAQDPRSTAARDELKSLSDMQVFDEPIADRGEVVDSDTTAKLLNPPIQSQEEAWNVLATKADMSSSKKVQVAAQRMMDAVERILDEQAVLSNDELISVDESLNEIYGSDNFLKITPVQRARLKAIFDRISRVSDGEDAKELSTQLSKIVDWRMQEAKKGDAVMAEREVEPLLRSKIEELPEQEILARAKKTIDSIVENHGTLLPAAAVEKLSATVEHLIDRSNGLADSFTEADFTKREQLGAAINKILSVLPPDKVDMQKLSPVLSTDFLSEVARAEDNALGEVRSKIMLANAAVQALTQRNVGVYPFPDELQPSFDEAETRGTSADATRADRAKAEMDLYSMNITGGIPGMSTQDIIDILRSRKIGDAIMSDMSNILTADEVQELRAVLNTGQHLFKDYEFDWQGIRDRGEAYARQRTVAYTKELAATLAAQGRGGSVALAFSGHDPNLSLKKSQVVQETLTAYRRAKQRWNARKASLERERAFLSSQRYDKLLTEAAKRQAIEQIHALDKEKAAMLQLVDMYHHFISRTQQATERLFDQDVRTPDDMENYLVLNDKLGDMVNVSTSFDRDEARASITAGVATIWDKAIMRRSQVQHFETYVTDMVNALLEDSGLLPTMTGEFAGSKPVATRLTLPEGVTRLYRIELSPEGEAVAGNAARARFLYETPEQAAEQLAKIGADKGEVTSVVVPEKNAEQWRVSKIPLKSGGRNAMDNPQAFSADPDHEFYGPQNISDFEVDPEWIRSTQGDVETTPEGAKKRPLRYLNAEEATSLLYVSLLHRKGPEAANRMLELLGISKLENTGDSGFQAGIESYGSKTLGRATNMLMNGLPRGLSFSPEVFSQEAGKDTIGGVMKVAAAEIDARRTYHLLRRFIHHGFISPETRAEVSSLSKTLADINAAIQEQGAAGEVPKQLLDLKQEVQIGLEEARGKIKEATAVRTALKNLSGLSEVRDWSPDRWRRVRDNWFNLARELQSRATGGPVNLLEELPRRPGKPGPVRELVDIAPDEVIERNDALVAQGERPEQSVRAAIHDIGAPGLSGMERMARQQVTPEFVAQSAAYSPAEQEVAREFMRVRDARRRDLQAFFKVTKRMGHTWLGIHTAEEKVLLEDAEFNIEQDRLLNKVASYHRSAGEALANVNTPESLVFQLLNAGYSVPVALNAASLVDALAGSYARETGRHPVEFYERAVHFVRKLDPKKYYPNGVTIGDKTYAADDTRGVAAKIDSLVSGPGAGQAVLVQGGFENDIFTIIHELTHSMVNSGVLREMLGDAKAKQLETWLGQVTRSGNAVLPKASFAPFDRYTNKKEGGGSKLSGGLNKEAHEKLVGLIQGVLGSTGKVSGPLREAALAAREGFLDYLQATMGDSRIPVMTGISQLETFIPEDVRQAVLGMFGEFKAPRGMFTTNDRVVVRAEQFLRGYFKNIHSIDITPILFQKRVHWKEALDQIRRVDPSLLKYARETDIQDMESLGNWAKALGLEQVFDEDARKAIADAHRTYLSKLADYDSNGGWTMKEVRDPKKDDPYEGTPFEERLDYGPEYDPTDPDNLQMHAEATEKLIHATTPIDDSHQSKLIADLDGLLGAAKLTMFDKSNHDTPTREGLMNHVVEWMRAKFDKEGGLDRVWNFMKRGLRDARQAPMEDALAMLGATPELIKTQNLGGLYSQAAAQLDFGVVLDNGRGAPRVISEPLMDVVAEIPESMRQDVWRYWAAQREIELDELNFTKMREYARAKEEHERMGLPGPGPEPPQLRNIRFKNLGAAQIVKLYVEGKYGKDGGAVGSYVRRMVQIGHAGVVEKLFFHGYITEKERHDLLKSGKWWLPMVKIDELVNKNGGDPLYNDGTREALKFLRSDLDNGIEHPLQNIARRLIGVHMFTARQMVRDALLGKLVHNQDGALHTDEELARMGIRRAMTTVHREVDEETYRRLDVNGRKQYLRVVPPTLRQMVQQALERDPMERTDKDVALLKELSPLFTQKVEEQVSRRTFDQWIKTASLRDRDRTYAMWKDGEAKYYIIDDPELLMTMESVRPADASKVNHLYKGMSDYMGRVTGTMGAMVTHMPQYLIYQPLRDFYLALTKSSGGMTPLDLPRGWFDALPALFPNLAKEFPDTFRLWRERAVSMSSQTSLQAQFAGPKGSSLAHSMGEPTPYKRLGEGHSTLSRIKNAAMSSVLSWAREPIEDILRTQDAIYKQKFKSFWRIPKIGFNIAFKMAGGIAGMSDASYRLAERRLLQQGELSTLNRLRNFVDRLRGRDESELKKARYQPGYVDQLDRLLTLDFSRKGDLVEKWAKLKMFAGPTFQDTTQHLRILKDPARLKSLILRGIVATTLPALANYMRWKDDEQWQNLNYWDKFNFMQLWKRKDGSFAKAPMGIGVFSTFFKDLPVALFQFVNHKDPQALAEWWNQSFIQQTPLQWVPGIQSDRDFFVHIAPTVAEAGFQTAINYDQISNAPVDAERGMVNTQLPYERSKRNATVLEYYLSKTGTDLGWNDWSSRMWHYYMRKQFPGFAYDMVYAPAMGAAGGAYHALGGDEEVGKDFAPKEELIAMHTLPAYGMNSLPVTRLYELRRKSENAMETWLRNGGSEEVYSKYPELQFHPLFKNAYGDIVNLKKARGEFMKSTTLPKEEAQAQALENYDKPMSLIANEVWQEWLNYSKNNPKPVLRNR